MRANKPANKLCIAFFAGTLCFWSTANSYAQDSEEARPPQAPPPGAELSIPSLSPEAAPGSLSAPAPQVVPDGSAPAFSKPPSAPVSGEAPLPGSHDAQRATARLTSVISLHDVQSWIGDFKNQSDHPSPQLLDKLATFYEWLLELLDEHNRLAATFAKNENTRVLSNTEKQTVAKLNHLKNETLLLRANMLIKLDRYAEAIVPLVDIVNAEPLSAAGKEAYKNLQDIGFSEIPDFTRQPTNPSDPSVLVNTTAPAKTASPATTKPAVAKAKAAKRYSYGIR